jgi:hypothetical protein
MPAIFLPGGRNGKGEVRQKAFHRRRTNFFKEGSM